MSRGAGHRVAAIGSTHPSRSGCVDDGFFSHQAGYRKAAGHGLGHRDQIRHHPGMLDRKHFAGAPEAGLDFVTDHYDSVFVANPPDCLQKFSRRSVETAFTLYRFNDNCRNVFRFDVDLEQGIQTHQCIFHRYTVVRDRERRMENTGYRNTATRLVRHNFAGQRAGQRSTAVKTALECDHTLTASGDAGNLDRVFHRFGAGGEKKRFCVFHWRQFIQTLRQGDIGFISAHLEGGMGKLMTLFLCCRHDFRMAMAGVAYGNSYRKINIAFAVGIP